MAKCLLLLDLFYTPTCTQNLLSLLIRHKTDRHKIIKLILLDKQFDLSSGQFDTLISEAFKWHNLKTLKLLLSDSRIDCRPDHIVNNIVMWHQNSPNYAEIMLFMATHGHPKTIEVMLGNPNINLDRVSFSELIVTAGIHGHTEIVDTLLLLGPRMTHYIGSRRDLTEQLLLWPLSVRSTKNLDNE
ncbi:MAG: hypothetical protein O7C56_06160 [Rickettsia endosymbiont of Ixodes persulcatus]|nr:hypothetical protein [Rickettsia endosymbiont of Ixodes persulcatus]